MTFVQPQSCATPAQNGAGGTLSGNVNTYYAPSAPVVLSPGGKTVTLGVASGSMTPISIGDLLLVIQMQDATINFTNTGAYGDGTPGILLLGTLMLTVPGATNLSLPQTHSLLLGAP